MSPVLVCLVLLFGPSLSVMAQSTETIGAGPANQGCTTTSNNPCFASIFDGTTSQGFADIYLVRKADGSFTNGTILRYINDTFQWAANNFTGTGTGYVLLPGGTSTSTEWNTTYDGDYSVALSDGSTVSGHVHLVIIKHYYLTGGNRRIFITTYHHSPHPEAPAGAPELKLGCWSWRDVLGERPAVQ